MMSFTNGKTLALAWILANGLLVEAAFASERVSGEPTTVGAHVVVIDATLESASAIKSSVTQNAKVVMLDATEDAVAQIGVALEAIENVASLHLITHGEQSRLRFAASHLDLSNIATYADGLQRWRHALAPGADIMLYGCNIAAGNGKEFIRALAETTGADVAASTNVTGHRARGGDWSLEAKTGPIAAATVFEHSIHDVDIALQLPPDFRDELVLDNLDQAVALAVLPTTAEMLVIQRAGKIFLTNPLATAPQKTLYLEIPNVDRDGEKGLLNIALDPGFSNNNYFYVYYHNAARDRARISRFEHHTDHADASDEFVIWEDHEVASTQLISDHWGGGMDFGPDGNLYLTIGDKKDIPDDAQDLASSAGKIIRVDPRGAESGSEWTLGGDNSHLIPAGNPFVGGPGLDEAWALGLRNPFRATWDLPSGRFYISEVGGNVQTGADASHEDLHAITLAEPGANFGWPACEGPDCVGPPPSNYSPPLFTTQHQDARVLIVGPVYRGTLFPPEYHGALFMTDFGAGWLRYITFEPDGSVSSNVPPGGFELAPVRALGKPVELAQGPEGALYYLDLIKRNDTGNGQLRRITFDADGLPPIITQATADTGGSQSAPLTVSFEGAATDPQGQGQSLEFLWDFGDNQQDTGADVTHTYTDTGTFNAVLRVTNDFGTATSAPITIVVGSPPQTTIDLPADGSSFRAGDLVSARGSAVDDGPLALSDFEWTVGFRHDDHVHPVLTDVTGTACAPAGSTCLEFTIPTSGHDFVDDTAFEISLTVTDSDGLEDTDQIAILPEKVDVTFDSNVPDDVTFLLDQVPRVGPFVLDTLVGFEHQIQAPANAASGGDLYEFQAWSNGPNTPLQTIVVPTVDRTFSASYADVGAAPRVISGLQVLYTFDAGSNDTVFDRSGVGAPLDLTIENENDVTWTPGSLRVDSPTSIESSGPASKLNTAISASNALTLEAWIQPEREIGTERIVTVSASNSKRNVALEQGGGGTAPGSRYDVRLRTSATGNNGSSPFTRTDKHVANAGELQHVVYTREASGTARIYVDGVVKKTQSISGSLNNWDDSFGLALASEIDGSKPWLGRFYLVAIYDRALNQGQVAQNYGAGPSGDVGGTAENRPPVLTSFNNQNIVEGTSETLAVDSNDPDGDELTLALAAPSFVSLNDAGDGTGTLTIAPESGDIGDHDVTVIVTDDGTPNESVSDTFTVSVTSVNTNRPPVLTSINNQNVVEGSSETVAIDSNDPDGDELTLALAAPSFVSLNDAGDGTGTLTIAPGSGDIGDHDVTVTVTDDGTPNESVSDTFTVSVTVVNTNRPPVLTSINNQNVVEGSSETVAIDSNDLDGDELTLALAAPSFVSLNDAGDGTGTLTIAPSSDDLGDHDVTVTVTDDGTPSESVSDTFTVSVEPAGSGERVTDALLLLYTFDAGDGDTVFDKSGVTPEIDLLIEDPDAVTWLSDGTLSVDMPTAFKSQGPAEKLNTLIPLASAVTLEAWVEPAREIGTERVVSVSENLAQRNLTLEQGGAGSKPGTRWDVRLRTSTTGNNANKPVLRTGKNVAKAGEMQHVVYTRDIDGSARIYVDGVVKTEGLIAGQLLGNWDETFGLVLANEMTGQRPWLGRFDLVAIYERALTEAEVLQNYNAGP